MDLLEYLSLLRRRWRLLAACVLVAGVAAFVTTPASPSDDNVTYRATHQILRDSGAVAPPALASVSLFVKTGEVPVRVAERIGYRGEPAVLAASVTLEADEQVGTLDITARGTSRAEAAERANIFAEETLALLGEQASTSSQDAVARVNEQLITLQVEIDDLEDEIQDALASGASTGTLQAERDSKLRQYGAALDQQQQMLNQPPPSAGYRTLQPALPELARVEAGGFAAPSSRLARTAIAVTVGLLLGLAVVLLAERLDTRLHDVSAAAGAFVLPVIAEIPKQPTKRSAQIVLVSDPMSAAAEGYRSLRASLLLTPTTVLGGHREPGSPETTQVVLVTSPSPGDGKTTTVANLAAAMAESGRSVLVLACDFRRPEVHRYFDSPVGPGIAEVLTSERPRHLEEIARPTPVPGVWLAPSGEALRNLGDVAAAGRDLIAEARELADIVIVDTPPILATNDASELIPSCDAVVVVCRIGRTTLDGSRRTRALLERLGAPVAGIVAVGVPKSDTAYSGYYTSTAPEEPRSAPGAALRRRMSADEISDRIGPWRGSTTVPSPSVGLSEHAAADDRDDPAATGGRGLELGPGPRDIPASSGGRSSARPATPSYRDLPAPTSADVPAPPAHARGTSTAGRSPTPPPNRPSPTAGQPPEGDRPTGR